MSEWVVVLVRTAGPVNLGMSARACANLGATLRLVAPGCEVDQPDSRKFANHAKEALLTAPVFEDVASAVADCDFVAGTSAPRRQRGFIAPMGPRELGRRAHEAGFSRVGLVFGNEADGLDNDELRRCQATVHLPTFGAYSSYNLSHAVAVTLYAIQSIAHPEPRPAPPPMATQACVDDLANAWLETLDAYGYFRRTHRERFAPKLRAMLGRLQLAAYDAGLLRGMIEHFRAVRDREVEEAQELDVPRRSH